MSELINEANLANSETSTPVKGNEEMFSMWSCSSCFLF